MFVRKKKIGNNYYYYLVRSVRTGPNSWKKYERYIGKKLPAKIEEFEIKEGYDVIIIGAGPAGLFAAHELAKKKLNVLVIEKGKDVNERKDVLSGVGGAGLFSDGKLNLAPVHGKTNLYEFLPKEQADRLIDYIDETFVAFGAPKEFYTKDLKKAEGIKKKAKKYGIDLLMLRQKHLGSDRLPLLINKFINNLKDNGVGFLLNNEVSELLVQRGEIKGVKLRNNRIIKSRYVIACPGRAGSEWFFNQAKRLSIPLKHRGIEVGVRVEIKAGIMKHITNTIWDPAFFVKVGKTKDLVRTFCTCPNGFVTKETYHGFMCVNGYCRLDKKSQNTNFALLVNIELTQPVTNTIAYGEDIGKLATTIAGGKPFIQRLDDLKLHRRSYWDRINKSKVKPTLRDVNPGDLSMSIPGRIVNDLLDALEQLDKIMPGVNKDALLYGPELKFFSVRIAADKNLETKIKNLFVAGDGVGLCGNIVGAAATGVIAAKGVLRKFEGLTSGEIKREAFMASSARKPSLRVNLLASPRASSRTRRA
ncbi:FAD-dependent oxidoreductase [Candidatus Woesearchaeota archaeon]|nr:FAD-dependent oxidoreductase [Candidatus Woesearchaeota archaeon]